MSGLRGAAYRRGGGEARQKVLSGRHHGVSPYAHLTQSGCGSCNLTFPTQRAFLEEHDEKVSPHVGFNQHHEIPQLCGDQGSLWRMAPAQTPTSSDDGYVYVCG